MQAISAGFDIGLASGNGVIGTHIDLNAACGACFNAISAPFAQIEKIFFVDCPGGSQPVIRT
jgi:hypothetical protein